MSEASTPDLRGSCKHCGRDTPNLRDTKLFVCACGRSGMADGDVASALLAAMLKLGKA